MIHCGTLWLRLGVQAAETSLRLGDWDNMVRVDRASVAFGGDAGSLCFVIFVYIIGVDIIDSVLFFIVFSSLDRTTPGEN